jgi:hypothetical protein
MKRTITGLNESASTTLTGAGAGQVTIGPQRPGTRWHVTRVACVTTANVGDPTFNLYVGTPSPGNSLGGTYSGAQDASDLDVTLWAGQVLTGVWANGDAAARATISVYGELIVG